MEDRTVSVYAASSPSDVDQARAMFRGFMTWQQQRPASVRGLIDLYFASGDFEREIAGLPGAYAPPAGRLLLAGTGDVAMGCVALRRIDAQACEMKRMFVNPAAQRRGVGRALATALIRVAREEGYTSMCLDTSIGQAEALTLYRSLGFAEVEPYYETPPQLRDWLVFMRLDL
jgi:GNAT superfamily N-acetyltransferase